MTNKTFANGLEKALKQSIEAVQTSMRAIPLSDLFVGIDTKKGVVTIFDDNEEPLHTQPIEGLAQHNQLDEPIEWLRQFFASEAVREQLEQLTLLKPFSVALVDDGFNVLQELLLLDDENLLLNNDLLERYDRELNTFLKKLLED